MSNVTGRSALLRKRARTADTAPLAAPEIAPVASGNDTPAPFTSSACWVYRCERPATSTASVNLASGMGRLVEVRVCDHHKRISAVVTNPSPAGRR
jgi:hypothetical protein